MNHSNSRTTIIIVAIAIFAIFHGGTANGQPSSLDEVRKKITPSHEIWLEYEKLKASPTTASLRASNTARQANQPQLPSRIVETQRKITPSHEIWGKYETLKYETTPAGMAERAQREAEEKAAAVEAERKRKEAEAATRAAERERERERRAAEAKASAEKAERERKEQYEQLVQAKNRVSTENEYKELTEKFRAMSGYKDTAKLANECDTQYRTLKENREKREAKAAAEQTERERQEVTAKANAPINLNDELKKNGLTLGDYAKYGGSATLKGRWNAEEAKRKNADAFDKADAKKRVDAVGAEIMVAREAIALKTFFYEKPYFISDVKVEGNHSSFTMSCNMLGHHSQVGNGVNPSFPVPGVSGTYIKLYDGNGAIRFLISGDTDSVQELVRNNNAYRVRIQFTNLQSGFELGAMAGNLPTVDVQNIEIVKVR